MSTAATMQFFVVTRNRAQELDLQRIDMAGDLQQEMSRTFQEQSVEFTGEGVEKTPFCVTYTPSPDAITKIAPFEVTPMLQRGIDKPQEFQKIQMPFTEDGPVVKAVLGIDDGSATGVKGFYFQHFDRSHILQKGRWFVFRSGMFEQIADPGVTISNRLTAVIINQELLFRTYSRTNQFLDLSSYFREASDTDIRSILRHPKFLMSDPEVVIQMCRPAMRKKFSAILYSKVLDNERATPDRIQDGMKTYFHVKLDVKIDKEAGQRRLVFPHEPADVGMLLEYLTDGVYTSHLTGEPRTSNSHRPLERQS